MSVQHFFLFGNESVCQSEKLEKQEMAIFVTTVTTVPSSRLCDYKANVAKQQNKPWLSADVCFEI